MARLCAGARVRCSGRGASRDADAPWPFGTLALGGVRIEEAFMTAVSPATLQILPNEYYKSSEEYTWALAEAIGEEYKAIVDAGFILQIDDPALVDLYDWWFSLKGDMAGYRKWAEFQVEAVNHALGQRTELCPGKLGWTRPPSPESVPAITFSRPTVRAK